MNRDFWPMVTGCVIGLAATLYLVVYLPMRDNYDRCGKVTLCEGKP